MTTPFMTPEKRKHIEHLCHHSTHRLAVFCHELLAALATAEAERDAYKRAKAENDERFMLERDAAIRERDALLKAIREKADAQDAEADAEEDDDARSVYWHAAALLRDLLPKETP